MRLVFRGLGKAPSLAENSLSQFLDPTVGGGGSGLLLRRHMGSSLN